ncbi:MAG: MMPL family transporter [Phaeodactylibacter sp.]|nr:MMPL family transporter [Phaeodactylibacter sp.]
MKQLFLTMVQAIIKHRWWWSAILFIATIAGAYQTSQNLRIDNSVSIWFLEDNTDYQSYLKFQHERGSDEIVIAMIEVEDALDSTHVNQLKALHRQVDTLPGVHATFSLANAKYPIYTNRKLYSRSIFAPGRTSEQVGRLLEQLPAISHQLIGPEGKQLFFYAQLAPTDKLESRRNRIVSRVQATIAQQLPQAKISGQPILNEAFNASIYQESTFFAIATVVVIFGLLFFLLPHWHYMPIAIISVAVPISILMGLMTSLGYSLNLISMLIPTILMVYSVSDAVHVINIFHQEAGQHPQDNRNDIIGNALLHSLKPCFYTTVTTVIGYLALTLSPLPAFRIMGLFTFLGMGAAFILVYFITAIGFSLLPKVPVSDQHKDSGIQKLQHSFINAAVTRINALTTRHPRLIIGTATVLAIAGMGALSQLEVNTDSLHLLGEGKAKSDLLAIEDVLGGNARFQLNIAHRQDSSMLTPSTLDSLEAFQQFVEEHPQLATPFSLVNFRDFLAGRSSPFAAFSAVNAADVIAKSKDEQNAFFSPVSSDLSKLSISVNVRELETKALEQLLTDIKTSFQKHFDPAQYELSLQGFLALFAQLNTFILQTQFRSFGLAFLLAFGVLFYFVGDWKTSLLVMLPNLLPLFLTATVMYLSGIALEAANAMLAPIMLGVAMDDTIHLLHSYQHYRKQGLPVGQALDKGLYYTGGALLATTIALVCGFLVVGASGVVSVQTFGLLCAFTVAVALIADIVVLPAVLKLLST